MSVRTDTINLNVNINGDEGRKKMNDLRKSAADIKMELQGLKKGTQEWIDKNKELKQVEADMTALKKSIGLTALTQKELNAELSKLKALKGSVAPFSDEFKKLDTQIKATERRLFEVRNGVQGFNATLQKLSPNIKQIGLLAAGYLGFDALVSGISTIVKMRGELEKAVKSLSAITGATGADLEFLKSKAIELSKDGTASAVEYVEAMKLIASAKPELLTQKEALVNLTESANTFANASGLALPDASKRLTDALNQFSEPASQATKYMDALAAGAKYGAAEVPEVTEALLAFGAQAKSSNINIYESTAAIEVLAEKGIKGAEAGTKLRNVFLALNAVDGLDKKALDSLQAAGVNTEILKDKTLSLEQRLQELSKISGSASSLVNVFGKENFNAGQIILQNIPRLKELTEQVKESGVANDQAATNTDTMTTAWERLKNTANAQFLEGDNNFFKWLLNNTSEAIEGIGTLMTGLKNLFKTGSPIEALRLNNRKVIDEATKKVDEQSIKSYVTAARTKADGSNKTPEETIKSLEASNRFNQEQIFEAEINGDMEKLARYEDDVRKTKAAIDIVKKEMDELSKSGKDIKTPKAESTDNKEAENKYKQLISEAQAFHKKLEELKFEAEQAGKSQDQKEIDAVKHKYEEILKNHDGLIKKLHGKDKEILGPRSAITANEEAELNALLAKQSSARFEKEQKEKQEALKKSYADAQQQSQLFFEDEKNKQAQRFVAGEIDKTIYEANLALIEVQSKEEQLANAEKFAQATVVIEGKTVQAVDQAAKDITKLKKEQLEKQTADALKNAEALQAELALRESLYDRGKKAGFNTRINVAKASGDVDGEKQARADQLEYERKQKLASLEKEKADALASLKSTGVDRLAAEAEITANINKLKEEAESEHLAKIDELNKQANLQKIQQVMEYVGMFQQALGSLNTILNNSENKQLAKEKSANDQKKAGFKKQLDGKLISKAQYDQKVSALDEEYDKKEKAIKRKQAERDKALAVFSAIVNTAAAIAKALPNIPLSIIAGVMGGLQIAAIASAPLPELGKGDWIRKGDKHSDASGGIHAKIERDEAVMSAAAMTDDKTYTVTGTTAQITSALNAKNNGTAWATGAVVEMTSWLKNKPASINPNMPRIMEQGGVVRPINQQQAQASNNDAAIIQLTNEFRAYQEKMEKWQSQLHIVYSPSDTKKMAEIDLLFEASKKASGLGS